jgi:hypothetical protein
LTAQGELAPRRGVHPGVGGFSNVPSEGRQWLVSQSSVALSMVIVQALRGLARLGHTLRRALHWS